MDREKIIKDLEECLSASCRGYRPRLSCPYNDEEWDIMRDAFNLLKDQEAEDILGKIGEEHLKEQEAVVRCKDCKYVECEGVEGFLVCDLSGFSHRPEFFCADGERR